MNTTLKILGILLLSIGFYEAYAIAHKRPITSRNFGGWSIDKELFDFVRTILPEGKTILELGSGWSSGMFSKYYKVYSVEHNKKWLNKYKTHYIYAPIKNSWYDTEALKKHMPAEYDLIIVDGPPEFIGRGGFYTNLHMFNTDAIIIFDDVHREVEMNLLLAVADELKKSYQIIESKNSKKMFGVIQ